MGYSASTTIWWTSSFSAGSTVVLEMKHRTHREDSSCLKRDGWCFSHRLTLLCAVTVCFIVSYSVCRGHRCCTKRLIWVRYTFIDAFIIVLVDINNQGIHTCIGNPSIDRQVHLHPYSCLSAWVSLVYLCITGIPCVRSLTPDGSELFLANVVHSKTQKVRVLPGKSHIKILPTTIVRDLMYLLFTGPSGVIR